jgi:hypothetical protein
MTVIKLVYFSVFLKSDFYIQGIQYGSSLGSSGCNRGRTVNLHTLHESSTLRAVKMTLKVVVPATKSIL